MIRGSVVDGDSGFQNNMIMLRADIFAALSISASFQFTRQKKLSTCIKKGLMACVTTNRLSSLEITEIQPMLQGWNKLLYSMSHENSLRPVHVINEVPELDGNCEEQDVYVYAAYLPKGPHKLLIYDPEDEAAWIHECMVGTNIDQKSFYESCPEAPVRVNAGGRREIVPNPFRKPKTPMLQSKLLHKLLFINRRLLKHFHTYPWSSSLSKSFELQHLQELGQICQFSSD